MIHNAISNAYRHLKSEGIFVFDFWYGPAVLTDRPAVRVKRLEDEYLSVYRIATPVMHMNENVVDVNYEVLIEDKNTKALDTLKETHRMRYFFLPELEYMLTSAGFSILENLAWMSLEKTLSSDSWYGVLVARK
jgi:SAM-dependent methyltransferase